MILFENFSFYARGYIIFSGNSLFPGSGKPEQWYGFIDRSLNGYDKSGRLGIL